MIYIVICPTSETVDKATHKYLYLWCLGRFENNMFTRMSDVAVYARAVATGTQENGV